jgi:hypothetical protein
MNSIEIVTQYRFRRPPQREVQRVRDHVRIAVAVTTDPAADLQERCRAIPQRPIPSRIERRERREKYIAQPSQRVLDFVGNIEPLAPQRSRLP